MAGFPSWDDWRETLGGTVRQAADAFSALLEGYLSTEHGSDGRHTDITSDSVETAQLRIVQETQATEHGIEFFRENPQRNRVESGSMSVDRQTDGSFAMAFYALTTAFPTQIKASLNTLTPAGMENQFSDALVVNERLRLLGQSVFTPAFGETALLSDDSVGQNPKYSYYRLTPAGNVPIYGIYADITLGARGEIIALYNDSDYLMKVIPGVVVNGRKPLHKWIIPPRETSWIAYDITNLGWFELARCGARRHDIAFDAANFTASGAMTWTVGSGDVVTYAYVVSGDVMTLFFNLSATSVGGTPSTQLRIALPAGLVVAGQGHALCYASDNGSVTVVNLHAEVGDAYVSLDRIDGANWSAATDATVVAGQLTFPVGI